MLEGKPRYVSEVHQIGIRFPSDPKFYKVRRLVGFMKKDSGSYPEGVACESSQIYLIRDVITLGC